MSSTAFFLCLVFVLVAAGMFLRLIFRTVSGIWSDLGWTQVSQNRIAPCSHSQWNGNGAPIRGFLGEIRLDTRGGAHKDCPNRRCRKVNVPEAVYCGRCGQPLGSRSTSR
jgi:hypothetical protein